MLYENQETYCFALWIKIIYKIWCTVVGSSQSNFGAAIFVTLSKFSFTKKIGGFTKKV